MCVCVCVYLYICVCMRMSPSWITALSWRRGLHNSMKLLVMPCRVTQDGQVIVKISDKMWANGGGNSKILRILS